MVGASRLVMRLLAALLLALGAGSAAHGEVPVETCLAKLAPASDDARASAASGPRFDCRTPQTAHGPGDFAVQLRFAPVRADPADPLILRTTSVWQQGARVVFRYDDGTSASLAFDSASADRYLSLGALFEVPVPARAAPLTGITIETRDSANWRGVVLGAKLETRSERAAERAWLIALYAGFLGLSLALLVYNLALWSALRHHFQLVYCVMVGALLAYAFTSSGAALLAFPGLDNNDRMRLNYLLLALAAVAGARFIREFFGKEVFGPLLNRIVDRVSLVCLGTALAFATLAPWQGWLLDRFYFLSQAALLSLVFPLMWAAWRARSRYFNLFVLAWSAPVLVSIARNAHGFGLLPYSFWLDNSNLVALSIESLLSSLLIVARLRELSQDRDLALAGEQTALRLAGSDPLTGLLNRRAFLDQAIGREGGFRLMLLDIDRFKAINDRYGHESGDQVLRAVAGLIQSARPKGSLAVRLGGEEFALLVPLGRESECPPERLVAAIRAKPMPLGQTITVSLGFADGMVACEGDWKRLYRLADAALYRAKSDGRDRACRATDFKLAQAARG
jgi:diguanylate cyclase (GGDEF)-like protein